MGHPVLVVTTHLCHYGAKAAINNIKKEKEKYVCVRLWPNKTNDKNKWPDYWL